MRPKVGGPTGPGMFYNYKWDSGPDYQLFSCTGFTPAAAPATDTETDTEVKQEPGLENGASSSGGQKR